MAIARVIRPRQVAPQVTALLGFVAGFVDVAAFLGLFRIFVAQLTGSFVFAGAQLVSGHYELTVLLAIPAFFVAGCVATALAVWRAHTGRALAWVLALECALLAAMLATMLSEPLRSSDSPAVIAAAILGIAAMGVQSAMVRLFMRGAPSTNVMTTNTSQIAIDATILLLSFGERLAAEQARESRERLAHYWPPMAGFVAGTGVGALCEQAAGNVALAIPLLLACGLLGWAARSGA